MRKVGAMSDDEAKQLAVGDRGAAVHEGKKVSR
jgi:hypothetical protein